MTTPQGQYRPAFLSSIPKPDSIAMGAQSSRACFRFVMTCIPVRSNSPCNTKIRHYPTSVVRKPVKAREPRSMTDSALNAPCSRVRLHSLVKDPVLDALCNKGTSLLGPQAASNERNGTSVPCTSHRLRSESGLHKQQGRPKQAALLTFSSIKSPIAPREALREALPEAEARAAWAWAQPVPASLTAQ